MVEAARRGTEVAGTRGWRRTARDFAARALRALFVGAQPDDARLPLSSWHLSRDAAGDLVLGGVALRGVLDRWGSPVHVVDLARLADNAARFIARPPGAARGVEVFYSYKTNPVPGLLRELHARGLGAEVVSPYELWLALRLGVPPASIVYNGPARTEESLVEALRQGVGLINLNCRGEIGSIARLARRTGTRPRIGIRVVVPGTWGGQFGERIDRGAALGAFEEALATPELQVVALHAHPNEEIATVEALEGLLSGVLAFADLLRARTGLDLEILDLGGNLACQTVSRLSPLARRLAVAMGRPPRPRLPASVLSIEDYVAHVAGRVETHYAKAGRPAPRVFVEPGRALSSNAQMLLCKVLQVREEPRDDLTWIVLDAGINVAEAVRSEWHQLVPLREPSDASVRMYRVAGPSCTLGDLLYPAWLLPRMAQGDALAIMDAGAYFEPFSTDFSFPRPGVVVLDQGREVPIRRAATFEDLVARDGPMGHGRQAN
jgi:diaminopimelate decarboxylase